MISETFMYSIVVGFSDEGSVESMTFGDNTTLEIIDLDVSECPDFVLERIAWLKLLPSGQYLRKNRRLLGIKIADYRSHIYMNKEERNALLKFIKEKESAKCSPSSNQGFKRNTKPNVKRTRSKDGA